MKIRVFLAALAAVLLYTPAWADNAHGLSWNAPNGVASSVGNALDGTVNLNAVSLYNAVPDGHALQDTITTTSGSPTITFTNASFTAADVGKPVFLQDVAAGPANFVGTIAAYHSAHSIDISANAGTTISAVVKEVAWGTDNTTAFNNMAAAARTLLSADKFVTGVRMVIPQGNYYVGSALNFTGINVQGSGTPTKPVSIEGAGATIIGTAVTGNSPTGIIMDALGDAGIRFRDFTIYAGQNAGNAAIGLQIGRYGLSTTTNAGAQAVYNVLDNIKVRGWFERSAVHDFAAEDMQCQNSTFYNARTGSGSYALTLDGINHQWADGTSTTSSFQTQANSADTAVSFDDTKISNCHMQNVGPSPSVWLANTRHIEFESGYIQNQANGGTNGVGVALYNMSGASIIDAHFNVHIELAANLAHDFLITGTAATPTIIGFSYANASEQALTSLFALDTGVTQATFNGFKISFGSVVNTPTVFDTPGDYILRNADVFLPGNASVLWPTNPGVFLGHFCSAPSVMTCGNVMGNSASPPSGMLGTWYYDGTNSCASLVVGTIRTCVSYNASAPKTANYTVTITDGGRHFTNNGAAGEVDFSLPAAQDGLAYCFGVEAAQTLKIIANGTDKIYVGGTASAAGGNILASAIGASACLESHKTGNWIVVQTPDKTQWTVN